MNILVIGNGFDLAHGLPTKYTDFLFFCSIVKRIIQNYKIDDMTPKDYSNWLDNDKEVLQGNADFDENRIILSFTYGKYNVSERDKIAYGKIIDYFKRNFFNKESNNKKLIKVIIDLVHNNFWVDYFLQCDMHDDENWIDFESEISNVIKSIDDDMRNHVQGIRSLNDKIDGFSNEFLKRKYNEYIRSNRSANKYLFGADNVVAYREIRNKLYNNLNRLIRVFEIYLAEYVEKMDCNLTSPNIQKVLPKEIAKINGMPAYDTYVLSFNYTNTYQRLYIDKEQHNRYFGRCIDYIHGKANINNTIESNNMVLGIDEYLPEDRKNKDVEFITFKKFYQRIHKQTGCKYKNWADEIREEWNNETV